MSMTSKPDLPGQIASLKDHLRIAYTRLDKADDILRRIVEGWDGNNDSAVAAAIESARVHLDMEASRSPITDDAIDAAVAEADPLAGLPEEERQRIQSVGHAARFRTYRDSGETNHALASENARAAITREVAAYRARQVPETLTREEAEQRLRAVGVGPKTIKEDLVSPRDVIACYDPNNIAPSHAAHVAARVDILRAYVRGLDAKASEARSS